MEFSDDFFAFKENNFSQVQCRFVAIVSLQTRTFLPPRFRCAQTMGEIESDKNANVFEN